MDWLGCKGNGKEFLRKYRFFLIILLAGVLLMVMPERKQQVALPETQQETAPETLGDALGEILSKIEGAGRVSVLLTEAVGEKTYYQTDQDITNRENGRDIRSSTVLVTNAGREETGLILQIDPPVYKGAVVICQGADRPSVKLAIVEAVSNATGLSTDKITVLKMK